MSPLCAATAVPEGGGAHPCSPPQRGAAGTRPVSAGGGDGDNVVQHIVDH